MMPSSTDTRPGTRRSKRLQVKTEGKEERVKVPRLEATEVVHKKKGFGPNELDDIADLAEKEGPKLAFQAWWSAWKTTPNHPNDNLTPDERFRRFVHAVQYCKWINRGKSRNKREASLTPRLVLFMKIPKRQIDQALVRAGLAN